MEEEAALEGLRVYTEELRDQRERKGRKDDQFIDRTAHPSWIVLVRIFLSLLTEPTPRRAVCVFRLSMPDGFENSE